MFLVNGNDAFKMVYPMARNGSMTLVFELHVAIYIPDTLVIKLNNYSDN